MNSKQLFLLPLFLISSAWALDGSVYGKIRTAKNTVLGLTSPYFVTFEHQGKLLAYPVDTTSPSMAKKIRSFVDRDALIEGEIKKVSFKTDGQVYTVEKFIPRTIKALELSALGDSQWTVQDPTIAQDKKKKDNSLLVVGSNNPYEGKLHPNHKAKPGLGLGMRLNDNVANAMIFTGAAALIGSQLLKK